MCQLIQLARPSTLEAPRVIPNERRREDVRPADDKSERRQDKDEKKAEKNENKAEKKEEKREDKRLREDRKKDEKEHE